MLPLLEPATGAAAMCFHADRDAALGEAPKMHRPLFVPIQYPRVDRRAAGRSPSRHSWRVAGCHRSVAAAMPHERGCRCVAFASTAYRASRCTAGPTNGTIRPCPFSDRHASRPSSCLARVHGRPCFLRILLHAASPAGSIRAPLPARLLGPGCLGHADLREDFDRQDHRAGGRAQ